ncbi:MAG: VWA domain-containing protein [Candidatus Shapirobacteria bacterium]|nr:VWA domain-containing protein [Candidatus Shapirobacteria bacterium]
MLNNNGLQITIGKEEIKQSISGSNGMSITIQGKEVMSGQMVDLVFVIDTTGSMNDKIDGLLKTCTEFVEELSELNLNQQMAIVSFGDLFIPGDRTEIFPFTEDITKFKEELKLMPRNSGGGNEGESPLEALETALSLSFRPNAVKAFILVTDDSAHQTNITAEEITKELIKKEVLTFVISPPLSYYKEMALRTGGTWFQVAANTDFKSILTMFRSLIKSISTIVTDVHQIGQGSVSKYLQLKAGEK